MYSAALKACGGNFPKPTFSSKASILPKSLGRPYQINARDGDSLKHKCFHEDPKGHPVGIESICKNLWCNDTICFNNTPGCSKISEENAIFNLTHSSSVNGQPTVPLKDEDFEGNEKIQYGHKFTSPVPLKVGEGILHKKADKLCNHPVARQEIHKEIKDK